MDVIGKQNRTILRLFVIHVLVVMGIIKEMKPLPKWWKTHSKKLKSELDEKLAVACETIEAQQLPQEEDPDDQQLGKDISENSNSQESQIMIKFFNAMGQNK